MEFTVNDIKDSNPIGSIIQFAGANAPVGWLICDGSAISRTVYSILFSVIGTTYGVGDGSTTFNLPNLQNRVPLGTSSTYTLGSTGGESTHTLTTTEMPQHYHSELHWQAPTGDQFGFNSSGAGTYGIAWTQGASDASTYTGYAGGGAAHNNVQPYISLNYIIKVTYSYAVVDGYNNIYALLSNISYSSSEIDTGATWIDGKKIYRKVISSTTPTVTSNSSYDVSTGVTMSSLVNLNGYLYEGGAFYPIDLAPTYVSTTSEIQGWTLIAFVNYSGANIHVQYGVNYSNAPIYYIMEYTKA